MNPNFNLWVIPVLALTGAAINGLFGRRFAKPVVAAVGLLFTGAAFLWAVRVALAVFSGSVLLPHTELLASWIRSGSFHADFAFYLDQLSMVMLLVVTGVGFLIHVYSVGYMWEEGGFYRYFSYLNLFMFFMLTLVLAGNYLLMFIGWEGVGLASYLLIGFFFLRDSAAAAGKKAFITNRIGDFGFLIALFLLIQKFGSLDFTSVAEGVGKLPTEAGFGLLTAIGIFLMVGACGKSAQIPLYVWLPDAMEGPTPVSALIHAATMVTAGVYMVARSHVIFDRAPLALAVVAVVGTLTAFFAATIGIAQTDIKRVLAYSTVSQLGYMFMACGAAAYAAGVFHLMTHAFFKGLLFLGSGSVIHALSGEQDMRNMGGLRTKIPWTFAVMTAGTVAIAGIPPFAGFWSKDEILWKVYSHGPKVLWALGLLTAFITSFYMFRLWFMTFFGEYRGKLGSGDHGHGDTHGHGHGHGGIHESPMIMIVPLVILALLSIGGGFIDAPKFLAPVFATGSVHVEVENRTGEDPSAAHALSGRAARAPTPEYEDKSTEHLLMGLSIGAGILGFLLAFQLYHRRPELPGRIADSISGLYHTVASKYYVDEIYNWMLIAPLIDVSRRWLWRGVDQGGIDTVVDDGAIGAREVGEVARHMQSGNLRSYAGWLAAGAAVVVAYMVWLGVR
jgi:NADH-quinone oxidoreductase subunit L